MNELNFAITFDEAQQVVNALAARPYNEVYQLIGKFQEQATRATVEAQQVQESQLLTE